MWQSPPYTITREGGSIHITCSTRETLQGIYLKRHQWPEPANVIYYEDGKKPTVNASFWDRVAFSGPQHNLTITLHGLQPADTGAYFCQVFTKDDELWGPGTLVVVTGRARSHAGAGRRPRLSTFPHHLLKVCLPAPARLLQEASWIAPRPPAAHRSPSPP